MMYKIVPKPIFSNWRREISTHCIW